MLTIKLNTTTRPTSGSTNDSGTISQSPLPKSLDLTIDLIFQAYYDLSGLSP
jgi:hypothetical protein